MAVIKKLDIIIRLKKILIMLYCFMEMANMHLNIYQIFCGVLCQAPPCCAHTKAVRAGWRLG